MAKEDSIITHSMTEINNSIPDSVLQDIKSYKKLTGRDLDLIFFNNFGDKILGGADIEVSDELLDRKKSLSSSPYSSAKRLEQTRREFLTECAKACEELGLDEQTILQARYEDQEHIPGAEEKLIDLYLPIYANLRLKGYNKSDLTS